ncbi:MAG: hypothetical protein ACJAT7_000347 [Psychromonas sp.]|jgi:hypothetical protein|uniref:hypothetical protein n=1 Tax=Psychromonas sp. TaxID=1884585 RepID=UPI0039E690F2
MLNILKKRLSLLFYTLLLSACGGSGGETQSPVVVDSVIDSAVESISTEEAPLAIHELVATRDFSFTTKTEIEVEIVLNDYQDQRAYVSIYSIYQRLDSGRYYPDSASKVIDGGLLQGEFRQAFIGLNNQQHYLAEVWLYDGSDPLQKELFLNNSDLTW